MQKTNNIQSERKKIDKKYEKNSIKKAKNFRSTKERIRFFLLAEKCQNLVYDLFMDGFCFPRRRFFFIFCMLMLQFNFIHAVVHIMNSMKSNFLLWLCAHSLTHLSPRSGGSHHTKCSTTGRCS